MAVIKKPDLSDPFLRAKLAKGMGHSSYGEPAWPNDLLYIFPVCIIGTFACVIGLAVFRPCRHWRARKSICNPSRNFTRVVFLSSISNIKNSP